MQLHGCRGVEEEVVLGVACVLCAVGECCLACAGNETV